MDQDLAFLGFNALMFLVGVAVLSLLWIASRVRTRSEGRPTSAEDQAPLTGKLLDASITRRYMRFSAPDEPEDQ